VVGLQMMLDPSGDIAKLLPFWSSREIGTYAVDRTGGDYLLRGLTHAAATTALLLALVALAAGVRLRRRRHLHLAEAR
jgi:MYXO-CTERM domain-containing protein